MALRAKSFANKVARRETMQVPTVAKCWYTPTMKKPLRWKLFVILLSLSLLSVLCVFPYVLTLQGDVIRQIGKPIGVIVAAQLIQSAILFSIAILLGLFFAERIQFRLPLLEAIVEHKDWKTILHKILGVSVVLGIATAVIIYVLDLLFTLLGAAITTHQNPAPVWQRLLAAFYGGTTEEILLRLFVMTLFIWLIMKLQKRQQPTTTGIAVSIVLAAAIFGLGHLPLTASLTTLTPLIVSRAVVLNGVGGIVFGWLFWKKGLESAMIAHFTTDIVLLTLLPLFVG
jgi:hypothetical protein